MHKVGRIAVLSITGVSVVVAIYFMCKQMGLVPELDFGAGAYYYADIPDYEKVDADGKFRMDENGERFPPYPIDYGAIVPKRSECRNLLVPVCVSASHMAFGSIRMEPVFFALGQAAGAASAVRARTATTAATAAAASPTPVRKSLLPASMPTSTFPIQREFYHIPNCRVYNRKSPITDQPVVGFQHGLVHFFHEHIMD